MAMRRWLIFLVSLVSVLTYTALAQEKPARLVYDVISVRPSSPDAHEGFVAPLPNGTGYKTGAITVRDMLTVMYRIPYRQIRGGPEWVSKERFDVQAIADHPYSIDDLHLMFQNLLMDRFHLKLHIETRLGPVYVLTVAKSGLKMTPVEAGAVRNIPISTGANEESIGSRVPMNYLCFWLGQRLQDDQRPVTDKTGLTGTYDFKVSFRPQLPPDAATEGLSPEIEALPSIFDALKNQLGLELVPKKGPVDTIVIDDIQKPSEN